MSAIKRAIIMVDTETLAKRWDAVATQIAFVAVDADDPTTVLRYAEEFLPIQPQLALDRIIDADTMLWWMRQPAEALNLMQRSSGNDMDELMALVTSIHKKLRETIESVDEYEVFSRGMDFDFPIVDSLFVQAGLDGSPWAYYRKFDLRTTMLEAGIKTADVPRSADLAHHVALHDCKYQLACLFEARRKMRARV